VNQKEVPKEKSKEEVLFTTPSNYYLKLPEYITYQNKRIIPESYKKIREARMNRTMQNIRNEKLGIARNRRL